MGILIDKISHDSADVWVGSDGQEDVDYYYGGTRMVNANFSEVKSCSALRDLMIYESALKNRLINFAIQKGAFSQFSERLPSGFLDSKVGGARCVIKPKNIEIEEILRNPQHADFRSAIIEVLKPVAKLLNREQGKIKLTPDFGKYAGVSDIFFELTEHVLGIACPMGGCGGKSSYSATGIITALERLGIENHKDQPITLIGSDGALGSDVLSYLRNLRCGDLAIADLAYADKDTTEFLCPGEKLLPSVEGLFTESALSRGGIIIATTIGNELENSNWKLMPPETTLALAHNLALPIGEKGVALARQLASQKVHTIPGQLLTFGGALTSRLEWFWRQSKHGAPFDKQLAHILVREAILFLSKEIEAISHDKKITPYEAILELSMIEGLNF